VVTLILVDWELGNTARLAEAVAQAMTPAETWSGAIGCIQLGASEVHCPRNGRTGPLGVRQLQIEVWWASTCSGFDAPDADTTLAFL
jgi:hypothetical protein